MATDTVIPDVLRTDEGQKLTPLTEVVERLQELVGDAARIRLAVHEAPVDVMHHAKHITVLTDGSVGSWLHGRIEIGEHSIDIHSVTLALPAAADAAPSEEVL